MQKYVKGFFWSPAYHWVCKLMVKVGIFYAFRFSICQKNNLRMSRAVQLSQLSTPAFSTLLWKNSSHLCIRLTCKCFEDSSAWAWNPLLSRSTRAFVLIAYIRAKPVLSHSCAHWFAALFVPICAPHILVSYGKYLRCWEWFITFLDIFDSLAPLVHSIL